MISNLNFYSPVCQIFISVICEISGKTFSLMFLCLKHRVKWSMFFSIKILQDRSLKDLQEALSCYTNLLPVWIKSDILFLFNKTYISGCALFILIDTFNCSFFSDFFWGFSILKLTKSVSQVIGRYTIFNYYCKATIQVVMVWTTSSLIDRHHSQD